MNNVSVAIISDTHGHLDPRIADLIRECDYAIHAGDICGEDILAAMQPKSAIVIAVAGNNEPRCMVDFPLPTISELELPGGKVCIEHGHEHGHQMPCHDSLRQRHPDARVIVYGHTHKMVQDRSNAPWVINPGAAGQTRTHGGPSCLILTANDQDWDVQEFRFIAD
ncbi:MAG: metallophosphatase family protein [Gammaproteobacteria bacterium]|nr:metallophosphatase family protein [Gammaproteobacteria bacterium]MBU1722225.1 metallophosphatase family protein [Gammaproteobacteria bacterium]MBU2004051.1 metallophosphatase family protein [Gammaproteobacteria bacterium]